MIAIILLAASLVSAEPPPSLEIDTSDPWAEFSRFAARRWPPATGSIGTVIINADGSTVYWAKRGIKITDSSRCPSISSVAEGIRLVQLPTLAPKADPLVIREGTMYRLTSSFAANGGTSVDGDEIEITANRGGSIGVWIDQALAKLEACWPATTRFD